MLDYIDWIVLAVVYLSGSYFLCLFCDRWLFPFLCVENDDESKANWEDKISED